MDKRNVTLSLSKAQEKKVREAAGRYGFSAEYFLSRVISDVTRTLLEIPEESLDDYENADEIRASLKSALRDEREGKLLSSLPPSITGSKNI